MGVETDSVNRTAVIIATRVEMLESLVASAGFEVMGAADRVVNGERLVLHFRPDVVIVENDLPGEPGWEAVPHLRAASPSTQVLVVVNETLTPRSLDSAGAFAVVTRSRLTELVTELGRLDEWISAAQVGSHPSRERRKGSERRLHQDWNKVGWERREKSRRQGRLEPEPGNLVGTSR